MRTIREMMDLKGRRALITGAIGGIGWHIAMSIAELGGDLILVDRPGSDYEGLKSAILNDYNVQVQSMDCDLENSNSRAGLIKELTEKDTNLNILVNNAAFVGTSELKGWVADLEGQSLETWRRALEVNLTAVFDLSKGLAPKLKKTKNASIINMASIYGLVGPDYSLYEGTDMGNPAAYAASKGGLLQLTRWLSTTLAPYVRINSITPGGVFRDQPTSFVERYETKAPLGRMSTEEDFKGAISYLASDLSAYVTGQNLIVDGGWTVL